jgi:guanylate kinase
LAPSSARRCWKLPNAPDQDARAVLILVLFGPGGVGKGTVIRRLLERDAKLWLSRSWTTRTRRPGEPADAYTFVSREEFEAKAAEGGFLEWARVLDDLYGTPSPEAPPGRDVVLEIDVQGAEQVLATVPEAVCVLMLAPSEDAQAARLRRRGDDDEHVQRRVELGRAEEAEGRRIASHVIVNDSLEQTTEQLLAIIDQARGSSAARP